MLTQEQLKAIQGRLENKVVPNNPTSGDPYTNKLQELRSRYSTTPTSFPTSFQSPITETPVKKDESIWDRIKNRGKNIGTITKNVWEGKINPLSGSVQSVGQLAGGVGDVIYEGLEGTAKGLSAITPDAIEKPIVESVKQSGAELLEQPAIKDGLAALSKGVEKYNAWKEKNPEAAGNLEASLNIASLLPIEKVIMQPLKAGLGVVTEGLEQTIKRQATKEALDITKPVLSRAEKEAALAAGRGQKSRLGVITIQPSPKDIRVAEVVENIVSKDKDAIKNINAINKEIARLAQQTEEGLKNNNSIFNNNQLRSVLNATKEESRVVFGTDKVLESNYDAVINEFMRIQGNHPNTIAGALQARKEFDQVMKQKFPNVFNKMGTDAVRSNAILDVRRGVNDFIASKLPDGDIFKKQLLDQSDMYTAVKNISQSTASQVDKTIVDKVMTVLRKNPVSSFATGGILTYGAMTGLITNPLMLGTLLAGGTITIGKKVIGSRQLREALLGVLKALQKKKANPAEIKAVDDLINKLDEKESLFSQLKNNQSGFARVPGIIDEPARDNLVKQLSDIKPMDLATIGKNKQVDMDMFGRIETLKKIFEKGKDTPADIREAQEILARLGKLQNPLDNVKLPKGKGATSPKTALGGLEQEARKYKSAEEFARSEWKKLTEYKDGHRSPGFDDTPVKEKMDTGGDFSLDEVSRGYSNQPSDYFDPKVGARYYMYDNKAGQESYRALKPVLDGNKSELIAYRTVPKGVNQSKLQDGDWITFSREYAESHGGHRFDGEYKIIEQKVNKKDVWWDGNDINEWGFDTGNTWKNFIDIWNKANKYKFPKKK